MGRYWLLSTCLIMVCFGITFAQQAPAPPADNTACIDCHTKLNPAVVSDWKQSKHSQVNVGCVSCHGGDHTSAADVGNVKIARPEVCAQCHQAQVEQSRRGMHARALATMRTQPNLHWRAMAQAVSEQGCATCHGIGYPKNSEEVLFSKFGGVESGAQLWGAAACSACHSRHRFSLEEARQPQACKFCHSGPDADQWGMYASSKHGILNDLKQHKALPADAAVPTCQTCHMPGGDHEVIAGWGHWGVRFPLPSDPEWAADRSDVMRALNLLDPEGQPTYLTSTVKSTGVVRFTEAEWQQQRDKMVKVCSQCHSQDFATKQLQSGDDTLRKADHLMAEAIRVMAELYKDGVVEKPAGRGPAFPWITSFDPPPTTIELDLQNMFLVYRARTFQGSFHNSPDYAFAKGLAEMQRSLIEIKDLAAQLRGHRPPPKAAGPRKAGTAKPK